MLGIYSLSAVVMDICYGYYMFNSICYKVCNRRWGASLMVSMYFGLPGTGKTTMLCKLALDASRKRSPYKHVYGNLTLSGVPNYTKIEPSDLGKYMLVDCLILIDEGTVHFDNREYKNFSKAVRDFLLLHRHYNCDLVIACQTYNGTDKSWRSLCDRLYMLKKGFFTGWYKTKVWRIPYDIIIPDKKDTGSAHLGEIIEGYCKPPFLARLFSPSLKRRQYYKYFDSWERPELPALPDDRDKEQDIHNRIALNNFDKFYEKLPKWRFISRYKYTKFRKRLKKCLTKTA